MELLATTLQSKTFQKKSGPRNPREYWIEKTIEMLGPHWKTGKPYSYKRIAIEVTGWPTEWIRSMYRLCIDSKEPARLWFGLIKKSKNELSNRKNTF